MTRDQQRPKQRSASPAVRGGQAPAADQARKGANQSSSPDAEPHRCTLKTLCEEEKKKVAGLLKQVVDLGQQVHQLQQDQVSTEERDQLLETNRKLTEDNVALKAKMAHMVMLLRAYQTKVKELSAKAPTPGTSTEQSVANATAAAALPQPAAAVQPQVPAAAVTPAAPDSAVQAHTSAADRTGTVGSQTSELTLAPAAAVSAAQAGAAQQGAATGPTDAASKRTEPQQISITIQHCGAPYSAQIWPVEPGKAHVPRTQEAETQTAHTDADRTPQSRQTHTATAPQGHTNLVPVSHSGSSGPRDVDPSSISLAHTRGDTSGVLLASASQSASHSASGTHAAGATVGSTAGQSRAVVGGGGAVRGSVGGGQGDVLARGTISQAGVSRCVTLNQGQVAAVTVDADVGREQEVEQATPQPQQRTQPQQGQLQLQHGVTPGPSPLLVAPDAEGGVAAAALLRWQQQHGLAPMDTSQVGNRVLKFDPSIGRLGAFVIEDLPTHINTHPAATLALASPGEAPQATSHNSGAGPAAAAAESQPVVAARAAVAQQQQQREQLERHHDDAAVSDLTSELTLSSFPGTPASPLFTHHQPRPKLPQPANAQQEPTGPMGHMGNPGDGQYGRIAPLTLDNVLRDAGRYGSNGRDSGHVGGLLTTAQVRAQGLGGHGPLARLATHLAAPTRPAAASAQPAPRPAAGAGALRAPQTQPAVHASLEHNAVAGRHRQQVSQQRQSAPHARSYVHRQPYLADKLLQGGLVPALEAKLMADRTASSRLAADDSLFDPGLINIVMEAEASMASSMQGDSPDRLPHSPRLRTTTHWPRHYTHTHSANIDTLHAHTTHHNDPRSQSQGRAAANRERVSRLDAHTMALRAALAAVQQSQQLDQELREAWPEQEALLAEAADAAAGMREAVRVRPLGQQWDRKREVLSDQEDDYLVSLLHEDLY